MRRFQVRTGPENKPDAIEGVQFSDGTIVLHGLFFDHAIFASFNELKKLFHEIEPEWIDEEKP